MVNVLSIQSHVAYGHVGNSSAVFPLQRLGIEVWPVHTVQFSNHTGYGEWTGRVFDGQAVEEVVQGIADRGVLGSCDAVLSGLPRLGRHRARRRRRPSAGCGRPTPTPSTAATRSSATSAAGSSSARASRSSCARSPCPAADIVTPNHFELDLLSGTDDGVAAGGEGRRRGRPGARAPGGADDVAGHRRHPGRRGRPAGLGGRPALPGAHAPARACR